MRLIVQSICVGLGAWAWAAGALAHQSRAEFDFTGKKIERKRPPATPGRDRGAGIAFKSAASRCDARARRCRGRA